VTGLAVGHERGREFADFFHVKGTGRAAAGVGNDAGIGIDRTHGGVPMLPQIEEALLPPENVGATRGVLGIVRARKIETGSGLEIFDAMFAKTLAGAVPAIDENAVHVVARHDFFFHVGHEFEVVRAEAARHPHFRRSPMAALFAVSVHGNPIGVRGGDVIVGSVGIGAGDDDHAQLAAAGDEVAEGVVITEPRAAMVKRNFGGIIGDTTTAAETHGVRLGAIKIIQPELKIVFAGIVLDEGELSQRIGLSTHDGAGAGSGGGESAAAIRRGANWASDTAAPAMVEVFRNCLRVQDGVVMR